MYIKEACIETFSEAILAEQKGADMLEVCASLHLDGLSPSIDLIEKILNKVQIPIKVMIRCRPGNFIYLEKEMQEMMAYLKRIKKYNISGYVFGALNTANLLDFDKINLIADIADKPITIHKCIDLVPDPIQAINQLKNIPRVSSILTSGKAPTAEKGIQLLKRMKSACGEDLTMIVAGKVTIDNIKNLNAHLGANHYHGRKIVGNL